MTTPPAESVVEYTIRALRDAIRDGRLAQGQRLVVADVTKLLDVSNGPVREAIRRLTGEGLVEITPNRGAAVRQYNMQDVSEIFQVREVLEGLAARLAAQHVADGEYSRRLRGLVAEMAPLIRQGNDYVGHNHKFHELIYEMSRNERLREQSRQLVLPIYRFHYHQLMEPAYAEVSAREHTLIADAILAQDGDLAERMMRNHICNSGTAMLHAVDAHRHAIGIAPRNKRRRGGDIVSHSGS
ncbi:GntR family transcriptional regulator [Lichenicoccus sp.]|uniref:GntR family transcriptional regulator n=1 Tax=Lichenicoccus sp. TaxID=2781899 RepID=UPI003D0FB1A8